MLDHTAILADLDFSCQAMRPTETRTGRIQQPRPVRQEFDF